MICQNKKRFQAKWFDEFLTIRLGQCIEPSEWVTTAVVTHFEDFLIFSETLFKNKIFLLDEIFQQNTSKFVPLFFFGIPRWIFLFHFSFCAILYVFPNECPGICQNRPGHSFIWEINKIEHYRGFCIPKIRLIFKSFARLSHLA